VEIAQSLHEGDEDSEMLGGMYVHAVIESMLPFQHAEELGILSIKQRSARFSYCVSHYSGNRCLYHERYDLWGVGNILPS